MTSGSKSKTGKITAPNAISLALFIPQLLVRWGISWVASMQFDALRRNLCAKVGNKHINLLI
jgi:hypothetical protein